MQVENIECQIAQAQIGNFLAGSGLSDEAMRQLEEHIAGCSHCKSVLNERRNELRAMLTGEKAVVDFEKIAREAEETKAKSIATALRKKSLQQMLEPAQQAPATPEPTPEPEPVPVSIPAPQPKAKKKAKAVVEAPAETPAKKPASNWKPLAYSLALAAVLVGMSLFSNNISAIFGPKLSDSSKVVASNTPPANTETKPAETNTPPVTPGTPNTTEITDTKTVEEASNGTTGTEAATTPAVTPSGTAAKPSENLTPPVPADNVGSVAGSTIGATSTVLATTQFDPPQVETVKQVQPVTKPVTKPTPAVATKPVVKTPATTRRVATRRIAKKPRRVIARRPAVRSRGIKVYNP